jgi:hypothetical protein
MLPVALLDIVLCLAFRITWQLGCSNEAYSYICWSMLICTVLRAALQPF